MSEKKNSNCSTSSNCYAITALCVAFLTLGLVIGNWIGSCQKSKKYESYSIDGKAGSTCTWSKAEKISSKECKKDSIK
ncbi:MAG: hypothetical protein CMP50_03290 [Flavobacteriales bacterium]|nr:hypothetical protein [Flavobacteriales bacterium]|tara:strand:+ start:2297 stop:2530 length:234 start_codon:yes stop_codon:yes gene_type:complete